MFEMNIWKSAGGWLSCPRCHNPKMVKYRADTVLINYPAFCKHCKRENLITFDAKNIK